MSEHNETVLFREKFLDWTCRTGGGDAQVHPTVLIKRTQLLVHLTPPCLPSLCSQSVPGQSSQSDPLSACDAKALLSGRSLGGDGLPAHSLLAGVDVGRGHGVVTLEDGRRMELRTLSVDAWHVQEFDDSEVPVESTGQLHEGDSYVIRWTYSVGAAGQPLGLGETPQSLSMQSDARCFPSAAERMSSPEEGGRGPGRNENSALFLWRGRHSLVTGRDTAAFLSIGMENHGEPQVFTSQHFFVSGYK